MRLLAAVLVTAFSLVGCVSSVSVRGPLDGWPLDKMRAATVLLTGAEGMHGSGALIFGEYVLTAAHVIIHGALIAKFADGSESPVTLVFRDETMDVAVVKLDKPPSLSSASLACRAPIWGEPVAAVGNALDLHNNISVGIIGSVDQIDSTGPMDHLLVVLDITFNHGMSGGPVFDRYGQILGFVDASISEVKNKIAVPTRIGLMMPSNAFCGAVNKAIGA